MWGGVWPRTRPERPADSTGFALHPAGALDRARGRAVSGYDSFNSLERSALPTFWEVATVLRFITNGLQASKHGTFPRQF